MEELISKKIILLNQTTLNSLKKKDYLKIIENFTKTGLKILDADFGFTWWRTQDDDKYKLIYKSKGTPYEPNLPRVRGGNFKAGRKKAPYFVEQVIKENYDKKYDVSPYMKSYVIIPITHDDYLYGNLVFCYKKEQIFTDEYKGLSVFLGNATAQTITINKLVKEERDTRMLSERHQSYFQAMIENSHEVVMLIDRTGKILYVSPSVKKIYGVEVKELIGQNIADFVYDKDDVAISKYLENVARFRYSNNVVEFLYKHKDDSIHSLESTAINMLSNPNIGGIVLNIRDITLKKRTEVLKETERLLQEEKLKTEFIANATHEIRTPLAIIRGNVDLAIMKGLENKKFTEKRLDAIKHEIEHMTYMLSDLSLLTSDREKITNKIVFKEIKFPSLINHIVSSLKVIAAIKKISIKVKKIPNIVLMGDEAYLEKMFTNLIKNAITYGRERGWISLDFIEKEKTVEIRISDNGIGIGKEDLPNIFERFYKVDKSHSVSSKRFGLGLAIVKWIISSHNGSIGVESELGKGSTFIVSLPILK